MLRAFGGNPLGRRPDFAPEASVESIFPTIYQPLGTHTHILAIGTTSAGLDIGAFIPRGPLGLIWHAP